MTLAHKQESCKLVQVWTSTTDVRPVGYVEDMTDALIETVQHWVRIQNENQERGWAIPAGDARVARGIPQRSRP